MRLIADPDEQLWSGLVGARGRKARRLQKAAVRMLVDRTRKDAASGRIGDWAANRLALALLQRSDGRMLAWTWCAEPELLVAIAHAQEATPQLRVARAMAPIEYDDTEEFSNPFLGSGEKLLVDEPRHGGDLSTASYTWDTGSHLVVLSAMCTVPSRFLTLEEHVDDLARTFMAEEEQDLHEA